MGHWYQADGTPLYTIKGVNGKERDTTLSDARKLKLVPSVSGIIGQLDKPQLTRWKLSQLVEVVKGLLSNDDEVLYNSDVLEKRIWEEYKKNTESYSIEGTRIHNALESIYTVGVAPRCEDNKFTIPVITWLDELINKNYTLIKYRPEESFCHKLGYGGKIDLVIETKEGLIILDFKTKQGKDLKDKVYDDYCMQLAAYADYFKSKKDVTGQNVLMCANMLISVTDPGVHHLHVWSDEQINNGLEKFKCLLKYWQLDKKLDTTILGNL